jgi:hypothetical protein
MKSIEDFRERYKKEGDDLRMGQAFMVLYFQEPSTMSATSWSNLFYETNEKVAEITIIQWLVKNGYFSELPEERK